MKPLLEDREDLVNAAVSYIDAKRLILFGVGIDVTKPEGLEAAATWLAEQVLGVLSCLSDGIESREEVPPASR